MNDNTIIGLAVLTAVVVASLVLIIRRRGRTHVRKPIAPTGRTGSGDPFGDIARAYAEFVRVEKAHTEALFADVAKSNKNPDVRKAALVDVSDAAVLSDIAKNDESAEVREAAAARLSFLSHAAGGGQQLAGQVPQAESAPETYEVGPLSDGAVCSDPECPCAEVSVPRGGGYLYTSRETVAFRKTRRSLVEVQEALASFGKLLSQGRAAEAGAIEAVFRAKKHNGILMCETGARRRGVDLSVAASDAKMLWDSGRAPLRETPLAR
jgi:hypothetical protein